MTKLKFSVSVIFLLGGVHALGGAVSTELNPQGSLSLTDPASETLQITFLHPHELEITEGETLILDAEVSSGVGNLTYRWETPAGRVNTSSPKLVFPLTSPYDQGTFTLHIEDAQANCSASVEVTVISLPPGSPSNSSSVIPNGDTVHLRVGHLSAPDRSWSWYRNQYPIPDGNLGIYSIGNVSFDRTGTYELVQFNPTEIIYSATLIIAESKLTNVSVRNALGSMNESTTLGFVTTGRPLRHSPASTLLLRSIGPTLVDYGISSALHDPTLDVYGAPSPGYPSTLLASNDNWKQPVISDHAGNATIQLMHDLGAFALSEESKDAAVTIFQTEGSINTMVSSHNQGTGVVLNELYAPKSALVTLSNASVLSRVGADEQTLIAGFAITGEWPLRLLIRGVGPGLSSHGVNMPVPNPKLNLYDSAGLLRHNNDNWEQAANSENIQLESVVVGAFPLDSGSNDAVILEMLPPGVYTIHLESVGNNPGAGLIEIYTVR